MNERITENLVRNILSELGYYKDKSITIEEQKSSVDEINRLLKSAGKAGKGGSGFPEFIIRSSEHPHLLIIVECKALTKYHQSETLDRPVEYAVDGAIHYSKHLAKSYDVVAIAVSGQTESELKISNFIISKGESDPRVLTNESSKSITEILTVTDYINKATYDPEVQKKKLNDLMDFSRELHDFMRDHAKLTESEKPLLVSGTLIALRNDPFRKSFDSYKPSELQKAWFRVIGEEIANAEIPNSKKENMNQPYSSISVHPELGKSNSKFPNGVLHELIKSINDHVWPYVSIYHDYDVVGRFYGEFLKYTGGDKKALGIVLTPRHITELFSDIANVNKKSKVLDPCCGTGGFLISAMAKMIGDASTEEEVLSIKKHGLIGIEQQPNMYALAASNMILRGDGKANLYQGSCFDSAIIKEVKSKDCSVGMVNPPYSQKDDESRELVFVRQMLDDLAVGALGIAIVPMSCAITPSPIKEELLKHHTLDAVMSMPDELFYPVGVVTCIMVFKAHVPHMESKQKTWFGYWKNDGFVKNKKLGRVDLNHEWEAIRDRWVKTYRNRDEIPGESVKYDVTAHNEWCAEAYMTTDYSTISESDFENEVKKYAVFKMLNDNED